MQGKVESEPQHFRIPDKPDAEDDRNQGHDAQRHCGITNSEEVIKNRPHAERCKDGEGITDRNVWKEISGLAHEEKSAPRAARWAVEIAVEQFTFAADRATQSQQRSELHSSILSPAAILVLCQTTVLMSFPWWICPKS